MEYKFDELKNAPLIVDAIYKGGKKGNSGDDPISKLFPKLGNMKRSNLFQTNKHISLNCIDNCIPIILPNLGKIGQRKEQNEKLITKTFIKNADVIKIN